VASSDGSAELRLVREARARRVRRLDRAEIVAKGVPALAFVAAAAWFAATASSTRSLGWDAPVLVVALAALSRLEFEVGPGFAVPTQLAFVPMLFALPLPLVPLCVCAAYVFGAGLDTIRHAFSAGRAVGAIGCSWFAFPPALLLWWAGEPGPAWRHWPWFVAALAVQIAADTLHTVFHERVAHRLGLRELAVPLAYTYGFDAVLAPVGLLAARSGGLSFVCLLPVIGGFELLARERRRRFDALEEAARLGELAITDSLTGLANRRRLDEALIETLAKPLSVPVTLCLLDLDHFKSYNDRYGHLAGDALLRDIAVAWRPLVPPDALLARLGGEEFALLVSGAAPSAAEAAAERIRRATPRVTCSAGVAHRQEEVRAAELLNRADSALYAAKAAGRACLVVERRASPRRMSLAGGAASGGGAAG
jgi:diguanylate cyclase (GGDEF)-like protein